MAIEWSERNKLIATVGAAVLVNAAILGFAWKLSGDKAKLTADYNQLLNANQALKAKADEEKGVQQALDQKINENSDQLKKFGGQPRSGESDKFQAAYVAEKLLNEANKHGLSVRQNTNETSQPIEANLMGAEKSQFYQRDVHHLVKIQGTFKGLMEFLSIFEGKSSDIFFSFEDLEIIGSADGLGLSGSAKHEFKVNAICYRCLLDPIKKQAQQ